MGGVPKQYRSLAGIPMLLRSLRPFASHPDAAHVVIALPAADASAPPEWLAAALSDSLSVVAGGADRAASVAAGLAALPPACRIVVVHDAARPLVERDVIDGVIAAARGGSGAIAAIPLGDTLKEADADGRVVRRTVPRDHLWRAQTPQAFPRELLTAAHRAAAADGVAGTDDAALVERLGAEVRLVRDSPRNLKVTTTEDLELAERWAGHQ